MKHILGIAVTFLSLNITFAQDVPLSQVPKKVRDSFASEFKSTNANWSKEDDGYEASFKKDGKELSLVFDVDGQLIERETEIVKTELPSVVSDFISKNYPGFKYEEIAKIESKKGNFFEIEIAKKDSQYELIFDSQGLIEKKVVDDKD